jgi:hypothetical protein
MPQNGGCAHRVLLWLRQQSSEGAASSKPAERPIGGGHYLPASSDSTSPTKLLT